MMNDEATPEGEPDLEHLLPLIREGGGYTLVVEIDRIGVFVKPPEDAIPDACFEPGNGRLIAVFASTRQPIWLAAEKIDEVSISSGSNSSISFGTCVAKSHCIQLIANNEVLITFDMPDELGSLVVVVLRAMASNFKWKIGHERLPQESRFKLNSASKAKGGCSRFFRFYKRVIVLFVLFAGGMIALPGVDKKAAPVFLYLFAALSGPFFALVDGVFGVCDDLISGMRMHQVKLARPLHSKFISVSLKLLSLLLFVGALHLEVPAPMSGFGGIAHLITYAAAFSAVACILYWANRLGLRPLPKSSVSSLSNHCLYLRSFNRDTTGSFNTMSFDSAVFGLNPNGGYRKLRKMKGFDWWFVYLANPLTCIRLLFFMPRETAEEQLIGSLAGGMPLVAIGKPGDLFPIPGVPRAYLSDNEWQDAVVEALADAKMVLIQPGASRHVFWEIDQAFDRVPTNRILFWLMGLEGNQARYDQLRLHIEERTGLRLPRALGQHQFLILSNDQPKMLALCQANPFFWPLKGCSVDFRRTLEPFFAPLEGREDKPHKQDNLIFKIGRAACPILAFCMWQAVSFLICVSLLICVGSVREQWEAWGLRLSAPSGIASTIADRKSATTLIDWRLPDNWLKSPAYLHDKDAVKGKISFSGWAYGHTGFLLIKEVPMNELIAREFERNPQGFVTEVVNLTNQHLDITSRTPTLIESGERSWLEAEFTGKHFDATWRSDTWWLRLFTPGCKGIQRTTFGPEGITTVFAFAPPTTFSVIRGQLVQILNSVVVGRQNRDRERSPCNADWVARLSAATISLQSPPQKHELSTLSEMELALPAVWERASDGVFKLGETADLTWSFRPVELTDETHRTAAERDFRHAQMEDAIEYAYPRWSESSDGVTVECESTHRWMVQHTHISGSGVFSVRARCAKQLRSKLAPILNRSVLGVRLRSNVETEQKVVQHLIASSKSINISGRGTKYKMVIPSFFEVQQEEDPVDQAFSVATPVDAGARIVVETGVKVGNLSREKWDQVTDALLDQLRSQEGVASVQKRELVALSASSQQPEFRFRCFFRVSSGELIQRTTYCRVRGDKCFTVVCQSALLSPIAHDSLFAPVMESLTCEE